MGSVMTNGGLMIAALMLLLAASAPAEAGASPETLKPQALFDQASAAMTNGDCAQSVSLFEVLEQRKILSAGSIPAAATATRKGVCLVKTGRYAEGEQSIRQGLPILQKAGENFSSDVADSMEALGQVAMASFDYASAVDAYKRALAMRRGAARVPVLVLLARATAFDGGQEPLGYSEEALAYYDSLPPKQRDKGSMAALHTFHARVLLNQGRVQEGYAELKEALALSGGLTNRTTLSEASMRADLAMAAALAGKKDDARLYLAYTGAGRTKQTFTRGLSMDPPLCGEETGLRPEDVAVVEFTLLDDGSVNGAHTIYSRGNRMVAAAFAKAVNGWYWPPEEIKDIPGFYRVATRVEMRCSQSAAKAPSIITPATNHFMEWLETQVRSLDLGDTDDKRAEALRNLLSQKALDGKPMVRAAALSFLARRETDSLAAGSYADQALAAMAEAKAPAEIVNYLRIARLMNQSKAPRKWQAMLRDMAAEPSFADDPLSASTALLLAADSYRGSRLPDAPAMLQKVANESRLPDHHPLRQAARLSLANMAAAAGDLPMAQRYFASTGLTEQQCALIGVKPSMRRSGAGSEDYPMEAARMGFEGWVQLEFNVTADGHTAQARPIVAYPPLIFVEAATGMTRNFRYETSYRPEGGTACNANREVVSFINP